MCDIAVSATPHAGHVKTGGQSGLGGQADKRRMGVRVFISGHSGNKEVNRILKLCERRVMLPGVDREQPGEDTHGADQQGHRV